MEKPASKARIKFLKLLPKAAAPVNFQNLPFSPTRDKRQDHAANRLKTHCGKGFSGPIVSIIPAEARRKPKNSGFEAQEPTSPKVSCMGQIKHKKKIKKDKHVSVPKDFKPVDSKKKLVKFRSFFAGGKPTAARTKSIPSGDDSSALSDNRAPPLGQLRRFASGRESLAGFDWTAQVAPVEGDHREYSSDEESEGQEEREVIIPFSAPILVGGGGNPRAGAEDRVGLEPRKEINLWKRRTMAQPRPLEVRH